MSTTERWSVRFAPRSGGPRRPFTEGAVAASEKAGWRTALDLMSEYPRGDWQVIRLPDGPPASPVASDGPEAAQPSPMTGRPS